MLLPLLACPGCGKSLSNRDLAQTLPPDALADVYSRLWESAQPPGALAGNGTAGRSAGGGGGGGTAADRKRADKAAKAVAAAVKAPECGACGGAPMLQLEALTQTATPNPGAAAAGERPLGLRQLRVALTHRGVSNLKGQVDECAARLAAALQQLGAR